MPAMKAGRSNDDVQYTKSGRARRVSPLKPGLSRASNWANAKVRGAKYNPKSRLQFYGGVGVLTLAVVIGGLWMAGVLPDAQKRVASFAEARLVSAGFVVSNIEVIGTNKTNVTDVEAALGVTEGQYLFALNVQDAQSRIESLDWVDRAIIRRLWPDTVTIQIVERRPMAAWQIDGQIKVIDKDGVVIKTAIADDAEGLARLVGPGAAEGAPEILALINQYPDISGRVVAISRVGQRRWDVILEDGPRIMLPADQADIALAALIEQSKSAPLFDSSISHLDMRLSGQLAVRLKIEDEA